MSLEECIRPEEWGGFDSWDALDPRRRHAAECARCRAQHLAYREMLDDARVPPGAKPEAAAAAMRAAFQAELRGGEPRAARRGWSDTRFARFTLASAAAIVTVVLVWVAWSPTGPRLEGDVLRGSSAPAPDMINASALVRSGVAELSWPAVPGATSYIVVFFDADLGEVHRIDSIDSSQLTARVGLREPPLADEAELYWRVIAVSRDRELASSPVRPFDLDRP